MKGLQHIPMSRSIPPLIAPGIPWIKEKEKKRNAITQCHNLKGKPDNLSRPEKNADSIKYIEKM